MIKRVFGLVLVSLLLIGTHATAGPERKSAKRHSRSVEVTYQSGAVQYVTCFECPKTNSLPRERFLSVEVIDDRSPVGYVDVYWEHDGEEDFFSVCGATDEPQRIPANAVLTIFPWVIPDPACPTGFTTSGTVKLTFLHKP